jgi:hypothetical protein
MNAGVFDARSKVVRDLASAFTEGSDSDSWTQGNVYRQVLMPLGQEVMRLEEVLDQLATCANMLCYAARDSESAERLASHRIIEGMEFEVMRAAWLLGELTEASRIHGLIGEHSESACPLCVGEEAFNHASG